MHRNPKEASLFPDWTQGTFLIHKQLIQDILRIFSFDFFLPQRAFLNGCLYQSDFARILLFFSLFLLHCHFDLITVKYFFSRKTDSFSFCFQYFTVSYWRRGQLFCSVESTTLESRNQKLIVIDY